MLPDSNIAMSFPRVAGTFTTSTPVALVKGSKMVLTTASSYAPPMVRTTIRPAAPARRTHTHGAARPALPARKVRRVTPPPTRGTLRSLVASLMVLPPPPGGAPDVGSASLRESSLARAPHAVKRALLRLFPGGREGISRNRVFRPARTRAILSHPVSLGLV